jgi:hypothetical protein
MNGWWCDNTTSTILQHHNTACTGWQRDLFFYARVVEFSARDRYPVVATMLNLIPNPNEMNAIDGLRRVESPFRVQGRRWRGRRSDREDRLCIIVYRID